MSNEEVPSLRNGLHAMKYDVLKQFKSQIVSTGKSNRKLTSFS
jgi:hypothetical protein